MYRPFLFDSNHKAGLGGGVARTLTGIHYFYSTNFDGSTLFLQLPPLLGRATTAANEPQQINSLS